METLLNDVLYGLRLLKKNPSFLLVAVLTLALGIGANATIFSVINAMLLKPLPYLNPEQLVAVFESSARDRTQQDIVSAPNFHDWQKQSDVFQSIALFDSAGKGYDLSSRGQQPERVSGVRISAGFFPVLGATPFLGRNFRPEEEQRGSDHVVILSYALWRDRYSADRALLGKTIKVDSEAFTVVGIMPPDFHFQFWSGPRLLWVPIGYREGDRGRGAHSFLCFARLKPGVTLTRANAEMDSIGRQLAKAYPLDNPGRTVTVVPLRDVGVESFRSTMLALFAAVGFVLLIACVNVANLMLSRGAARQKELALRAALGAGRARIVRQLLTESLLLALLGGVAGLLLAVWTTKLLIQVVPDGLRFLPLRPLTNISLDWRVLAFTFGASLVTGILFGLIPAFGAFRSDVNELLRQRGGGGTGEKASRFRYALVASEVALAMVILAAAGLMIESMAQLLGVDPGFNPKNVLTMSVTTPQVDLYNGPPVHARFCQDLQERVGSLAGIASVSSVAHLPLQGGAGRGFVIEGRPDPGAENQPGAAYSVACPDYLRTMGIPLLAGREFSFRDTVSAPGVALINQAMAKQYWPKTVPVGQRFKLGMFGGSGPWLTVIGVFGDVLRNGLDQKPPPQFLRPYAQAAWPAMNVLARTTSSPGAYETPIKKALAQIDPDRAASDVETLTEVVEGSVGDRRFPMFVLASLALLALALAAVGIAGVVSYSVVQRTNEIGIRMALGARPLDVLRLVVTRSMRWTFIGVGCGLLGSLAATRLLANLLFNVRPTDPLVLSGVAVLLASVALFASYMPARRAARVDPTVALRYE